MKNLIFIFICLTSIYGYSQQIVYTPVNPAFGGNSFNYQWLLSSAEAQNPYADLGPEREELTDLERFQENLNNQLLSNLSRNVFGSQLGEELSEGSFSIGDLALEIFETGEGLVINILDINTGEQTQIIVPN